MANVTMRDIAEKLGVSIVSVSKALTGKEGVSEELREKVKKEADRLGYRYNLGAKGLKEGRNYNVGVIIPSYYTDDTSNALYMKMYQCVAKCLTNYDYATMLELVDTRMQEMMILPQIVGDNRLDGLILMGELDETYLKRLKQMNIPMIYMDFYDLSMETDSVSMDNISAEYKMTEYLIELGHKKIAYVGSINATTSIMDRYLGYRRALHHYNILYREDYLIEDRGEDRLFKELALPEDMPTAFVCNNDEIACILIEKLEKMGYSVPEDISVTGFDNYPFIRRNASGLTTVDVDIAMMASEGVELLLERLNDKRETFVRRVVSGHIVIRKSTGKAATEP